MNDLGLEKDTDTDAVIRKLVQFPDVIREACGELSPNLIASYLFNLAQKFNLFYKKNSVLSAESEKIKNARIALTATVAQVIKNGLYLLGIDVLERM